MTRVFAALMSGHDHVAAEAARLLTRLWAPAAGRSGTGPWIMPKAAGSQGIDPSGVNSADDNQAAHSAKSVSLSQPGRWVRCAIGHRS